LPEKNNKICQVNATHKVAIVLPGHLCKGGLTFFGEFCTLPAHKMYEIEDSQSAGKARKTDQNWKSDQAKSWSGSF